MSAGGNHDAIDVLDRASVSVARQRVREVAAEAALGEIETERLAIAVSELAQNQLDHARDGRLWIFGIERAGVRGVEIVAADRGRGIPDPIGALMGTAAARGLGSGVAAVRRNVEELDLLVQFDEGTEVRARRFASAVPRHAEVAVLGRPKPGERVSGDRALLIRDPAGWLAAVFDGLGHGAEARVAADAAADAVHSAADRDVDEILTAVDAALRGTRGAAGTIVRFADGRLIAAGVGNVEAVLYGPEETWRAALSPGVLGARTPRSRLRVLERAVAEDDVLVVHTDGVSRRTSPREPPHLLRMGAVAISVQLLARGAKDQDDATVLVAR